MNIKTTTTTNNNEQQQQQPKKKTKTKDKGFRLDVVKQRTATMNRGAR